MKAPATPRCERERQRELDAARLLDTAAEAEFDEITALVASTLSVPIALVSLVDRDRQWFKSAFGLRESQTPRAVSFCGHVVAMDEALVVSDARRDERFSDNPLVLGAPNVVFYAGAPLRTPSGFVLGTLCAIDHQPRELSASELQFLTVMARQVSRLIDLRSRVLIQDSEIRAFAEQASVATIVIACDGSIVWGSRHASELLGQSDGALRGQIFSAFFVEAVERDAFATLLDENGSVSDFTAHLRIGAETHPVKLDAVLHWTGSSVRYVRVALSDRSESVAREKELDSLRQMFELSSDLICIADDKYLFEHVNPAWQRVVGWTREELLSRSVLAFVHPDDLARTELTARALLENRTSVTDFEHRFRCADGSYRHLSWSGTLTDGRFIATGRDVTERVRQRERSDVKNRVLRAIAGAQSEFIATATTTPEWWQRVLNALLIATESEYGVIVTHEDDSAGQLLRARAVVDHVSNESSPDVSQLPVLRGARALRYLTTLGGVRLERDFELPAGVLPEQRPPIETLLALSCGAVDSSSATVVLANRRSGYDAALVEDLAMVGLFIESVLSQLASVADRSAAETRLNAVINSTADGIVTLDEQGKIVSVNAAIERLFGYSESETVGQNAAMLFVASEGEKDDVFSLRHALGRAHSRTRGRSVMGQRRDGSLVPLEVNVTEFELNGTRYFTGILRDITERVAADRALRQTASQLANALQIARAGHWEYDVARDRFSFNDNFYRIFRTTVQDEGGYEMSSAQYALRFVHPEDSTLVATEIQAALRANDPNYSRHIEHRVIYADGGVGHIAVHFFTRVDSAGSISHFYGVNQDITERRQRDLDREAIQQQRRLNQELADKIAELDRSQALAALTSQCVELVQRCVSLSEGVEVISRFIERMFPSANVALYTQSATSEELALRAQYEHGTYESIPPLLDSASCWGLRTRRVYGVWSGGIHLPCAHCSGGGDTFSLCGPLLCLDRVYGLLTVTLPRTSHVGRDEASVKGTMAQFEAVVQSLSGALSSISLRESLQRLALVDELTGLPNRRAFSTAANRVFSRRRRTGETIAVAMFDLDHFKKINDNFGHDEGDRVLQRVAGELTSFFRAEDVIGRLGGEEFAVVLSGISAADAERRLDLFRQTVRERCALRGAPITVSVGFVHSDVVSVESLDQSLRDADAALYSAKRAGRDRVVRALAVVA